LGAEEVLGTHLNASIEPPEPIFVQEHPSVDDLQVLDQESTKPKEISQHLEFVLSPKPFFPGRLVQDVPNAMLNSIQLMIQ